MQGYDAEKALAYLQKNIDRKGIRALGSSIDGYLRQAQALDLRFMRESGVIGADGYEGEGAYDEDEAFEYILDAIVQSRGLGEEEELLVASLLDGYMRAHEAFLHSQGLA